MSKRVLVEVPEAVWQRIRVRAAEEGRAVKDVVTNALRMYLSSGTEPTQTVTVTTVVSDAKLAVMEMLAGRVMSGAELISAKERERRRLSDQDRLRTHPEDDSQDPGEE